MCGEAWRQSFDSFTVHLYVKFGQPDENPAIQEGLQRLRQLLVEELRRSLATRLHPCCCCRCRGDYSHRWALTPAPLRVTTLAPTLIQPRTHEVWIQNTLFSCLKFTGYPCCPRTRSAEDGRSHSSSDSYRYSRGNWCRCTRQCGCPHIR